MSLVDRMLSFFGALPDKPMPASAARRALDAKGAHALSQDVRRDWARLVAYLVDAVAMLAASPDQGPLEGMCRRICERAVRIGLAGLSWAAEKPGTKVVKRVGDAREQRLRGRALERLGLPDGDGSRPPTELEAAAAAFLSQSAVEVVDGKRVRRRGAHEVSAEHQDRAVIAAFHSYLRLVAEVAEELRVPAGSSEGARRVAEGFGLALSRAGVRPLTPSTGHPPDLTESRVVGYAGGPTGEVVSVSREGLAYGREVVRKAEVVLGRAAS